MTSCTTNVTVESLAIIDREVAIGEVVLRHRRGWRNTLRFPFELHWGTPV